MTVEKREAMSEVKIALEQRAEARGCSKQEIVRAALFEYLGLGENYFDNPFDRGEK